MFANGGTDCDGVDAGTIPVRSYLPNQFGLYDMAGNVWEWVEDCYIVDYDDAPSDGSARTGASDCPRVLRGGSWENVVEDLRSTERRTYDRPSRNSIGFRVAMTID